MWATGGEHELGRCESVYVVQGRYSYSISALLVLPPNASRKPACQQLRYRLTALHSQMERCVRVRVPADPAVFVASINQKFSDVMQAQFRCQVQGGIAIVCKVWALEVVGIVLDDALKQGEVLEVDGTPDTRGGVNPDICEFLVV